MGLIYGGNTYFYRRDCQGNIIAILDNAGAVVVEYKYDAWGNHEAVVANEEYVTLANLNLFRYRGYYYDSETGLYFLQTRYYDPEVGRFVSRDSIEYADPETICGLNLYAYCGNNPVMATDPYGTTKWWEWLLLGLGVIVVVGAAIVATVATGGTALIAGGIAIGGAALGLTNIVGQGVTNGWSNINIGQIGASMLLGGAIGGVGMSLGLSAGVGGATIAFAGGGTVSSGGATTIVKSAVLAGILFSINYHGAPYSEVWSSNSVGLYDGNGNLIYRRDFGGRTHYIPGYGYTLPHTNRYLWKFIKGAWRIVGRYILPF